MKIAIVSGHFNPLHGGHLDMIEGAAKLGDKLIVIVNNDKQQLIKKGKIILNQENRLRVVAALRCVDEVMLAIDDDPTVIRTLEKIALEHPNDELIFAQGGDRDSDKVNPEADVCRQYNIKVIYGVGGTHKADSSTRINRELGHEQA